MTVGEIWKKIDREIPNSLSCEWDNDGLLCCPDPDREVKKVLVALDAAEAIVKQAIEGGYDLILTHHPMIFHKLSAVEPSDPVAAKTIRLLLAGVSVISLHTRLDAAPDGVNDRLCRSLGVDGFEAFGCDAVKVGRIGTLKEPMALTDFAKRVREATGAPFVTFADAGKPVLRVAVLGGSGDADLGAAEAAGADTYVTGDLPQHCMSDAPGRGMNLITASHFYSENHICGKLRELALACDPSLSVTVADSNTIQII